MAAYESTVDLWFPVRGQSLPIDHGSQLYSALCRSLPELASEEGWGLHTVRGQRPRDGAIPLGVCTRFGIRLAAERIPPVLVLVGAHLAVGSADIAVRRAIVEPLRPWSALVARLVTLRSAMEPIDFGDALRSQLELLGIDGRITVGRRREILVHGQRVSGYAVRVDALSPGDAVQLQARGLGARRRYGCGMFYRAPGSELG